MKVLKEQKGVTILALMITVIVLFIIVGISIMGGTEIINTSKAETIETNMLTIKAKAKEYMEKVDSKNWASDDNNSDSTYGGLSTKEGKNRKELVDKYKLILIEDVTSYSNNSEWYEDEYTYYDVGEEALKEMNLPKSFSENGEKYLIRYPLEDGNTSELKMDIIYTKGIKYEGVIYYELSELEKAL